jgi:hypothetical protein
MLWIMIYQFLKPIWVMTGLVYFCEGGEILKIGCCDCDLHLWGVYVGERGLAELRVLKAEEK